MARDIFYDVVYSPDDGGYYCQAFERNGKDEYTTDVYSSAQQAIKDVLSEYPNAQKCGDFTEIDEEI